MRHTISKRLALSFISSGLRVPREALLNRFQELAVLRGLLDALEINCVIDVGANRGQYAHELRGIGFRGQIISFEPVPSEFSVLCESFVGDSRFTGYRLALGSQEKPAHIQVPRLTVMSSLLEPTSKEPGTRLEQVEIRRLDGLFPKMMEGVRDPRVFLKMDTQGYDLEVFQGAEGCLGEICGLQSEISVQPLYKGMPHYLDALATYEKAGFVLHDLAVVSRVRSGALQELNCFMVRP